MKKLFLLSVLILLPMLASADAVEINGIYYYFLEGDAAQVTEMPNDGKYSGSIVIPESVVYEGKTYSVTSIGNRAFSGCSDLTSVTIGNSVTFIGQIAFRGCSALTSLIIGNSVTSIGYGAFQNCSGLTSVSIPNSVTSIDNYAFQNCSGLTSLTIGNSVTSIGGYTFYRCSSLISLTIGNSVTTIGDHTFGDCSALTSVTIPNSVTSIDNGAFSGCSGLTSVTIPSSVTSIGNVAFYGCSGLTSLTIPNSVTSIGNSAFSGCSGLTSVTIPNSVTSIGDRAFAYCSGLTEVISEIQNPFSIDDNVFESISFDAILQVPKGTKSKYEAFSGWTNYFKRIVVATLKRTIHVATAGTLADNISEAEKYDIVELTLTGKLNGTDFRLLRDMAGNNYLGQKTEGRLAVLDISNATIVAGGEKYLDTNSIQRNSGNTESSGSYHYSILDSNKFPQYAFFACDLKIISIPNSVTSIDDYAFNFCYNLTSVTIPNSVISIGEGAFYCSGLISMIIPNSVTSIGEYAFCNCHGLTSLTIPNSVTSIGQSAFEGCGDLTSLTIPNSVTSIGQSAFEGCYGLTSIKVESSNPKYDSRNDCNAIIETLSNRLIAGCQNTIIPNSVTSIGKSAFSVCSRLTSITIPNSVTSIDNDAFNNCLSLTSLTIGNSVTSIGREAFAGCSGLTSVSIPNSVTSIGQNAFFSCSGLTEVISEIQKPFSIYDNVFERISSNAILQVPEGTKSKYEAFSGWTKNFKEIVEAEGNNISAKRTIHVATAGTLPNLISEAEKYDIEELTLTGELNGTDFRLLRDMAGNNYLGQITEGRLIYLDLSNAKIVAGGEKYLDTNFIKVNDGTQSPMGDFRYSVSNDNILPEFVFCGCRLKNVSIPNSVNGIGDSAFGYCSGLTSVTIPNSVTSIGSGAFWGCGGLTSVTIPNSVTSIGESAFSDCRGLTSVTIGNSVTSIGKMAFSVCLGLTSVTIPNSVTSIDERAFAYCSGLTEVISEIKNPFSISDKFNAFEGISSNAILQVPKGTKSKYVAFSGWTKNFKEIVEAEGNNTSTKRTIHVATAGTLPDLISEAEKYNIDELTLTGELNGTDFRMLRDMAGNNYLGQETEGKLTVLDLSDAKIVAGGKKYLDTNTIKGNGVSSSRDFHYSILNNNVFPQSVFYACDLKIVNIPNTVTKIEENAFYGCSGLTSVTIPHSVASIFGHAFYGCSSLTSVTIPNSVTSIGDYAFYGCKGLTSVTISNSVTSIGDFAFYSCSGLTSVTIPNNVTSIGSGAFRSCNSLTSVTIGNSVTSIGDWAFYDCYGLTSVTIPNSVTSIGGSAFSGCKGLTSMTIPNSVTSIGDRAFGSCIGLTSIKVESGNPKYDSRNDCNAIIETSSNRLIAGCKNTIIPNSVTEIGVGAFWGCGGLTSVTIPNSVKWINGSAFKGCSGLTSVTIPNSVTFIGGSAFAGCISLTSVTIPNSVTSIEVEAFSSCSGLTSVTIPNRVTSIGVEAFARCSGLTSVTIPNRVTSIGRRAFFRCSGLTEVISEIQNPFVIDDNVFESISFNTILQVPTGEKSKYEAISGWMKNFKEIVEAEGNNTSTKRTIHVVTAGTLADYISEAEKYNIDELTLTGELNGTDFRLLRDMAGCDYLGQETKGRLTVLDLSNAKIVAGGETYLETKSIQGYYSGITGTLHYSISNNNIIPKYVFYLCNLKIVNIPNSITKIENGAFLCCSWLTSVTIPNSVASIGASAFEGCYGLTSVTIPNGVTSIGNGVFAGCRGLTSVTIPNSVISIGDSAFLGCSSLTEVISKIKDPFSISDEWNAFDGISSDAILQVPKGTKSKYEAFSGWTKNFKEIVEAEGNNTSTKRTIHVATAGTLPDLISEAEKYNIDELTLTGELNGTDFRLLRDMAGNNYLGQETEGRLTVLDLSDAKIVAGGEKYLDTNTIKGNGVSNSGDFHYSILNNNVFPQSVFYACDLKIVNIPNSVTEIEESAFYGCSGLTSVTIPNSVTYIGGWAFYNCSGLTSVTIPNSVTSIFGYAFEGCSSLTSVTIPNSVTYIDYAAFSRCSGLTSVTIPNNVTYIGNYAFSGCSGLTSIKVESGNSIYDSRDNCNAIIETSSNTLRAGCKNTIIPNSVTSIGREAFYGCSGLTSINIPNSITSIGMYAFYKCSGLTSVTIPNSVTSIGLYAFWRCCGLTSVTIPNSVTSIDAQAFEFCSGLTSLTIGNSVTSIGMGAFRNCISLTSIEVESGNPKYDSRNNCNAIIETSSNILIAGCKNTIIPNSVISIGNDAFQGCSDLTSIIIPNSVTTIIGWAFSGCSGLTEVKSMIQEPYEINQNCWKDVNTDIIPLYVPKGTKSLYEATTGWNVFKNIIEMDDLLDSVEENGGVDFGGEDGPGEDSNLNGNVIGNIYYSIDDNNGEYSSEEGCIILKKPTSDEEMENLEGQDIFGEDFNENFTGIVFMVSPGSGTIKVNAESVGNMTLKVKIGDGAPMTFELEGKMKASFPYSVTEPTYVYIYGGETDSNNARSVRSVGENALKIYGIEWTNDPSGIDDIRVNTKAVIYNINGQRVQTTGKGLYIMNGKKVVMK